MRRRNRVAPGRRQSEKLERCAHRVRGVLTATCARSRAGVLLDRAEFGSVDPAGVEGANGFEDVLDREVMVAPAPGLDGAAVEDEPGDVHPAQRHRRRRNRLVTSHDEHEAVKAVTTGHELDRVGDDLAGDERGLHPLRSHRDAVADRDGAELHRRPAGRTDAFLHLLGEGSMIPVARHGLDP